MYKEKMEALSYRLCFGCCCIALTVGLLGSCKDTKDTKEVEKAGASLDCHPAGGRAQILSNSQTANDRISETDQNLPYRSNTEVSKSGLPTMIEIPGGSFLMGGADRFSLDREQPKHPVRVDGFLMDTREVTNAEFRAFVEATGYKTIAELPVDWEVLKAQLPPGTAKPDPKVLAPGSLVFTPGPGIADLNNYFQWWSWVHGADWKHPNGPGSSIEGKSNHPVVHLTVQDAQAYAEWAGKRLPTEAEWEWAARGGLEDSMYPWGDQDVNVQPYRCNFFQGSFPSTNTVADGFEGSAPVASFEPNGYGLYDMAGNVWEMTTDWFDENYYQSLSSTQVLTNPKGAQKSFYGQSPYAQHTVIKGGSFLCNDSYCSSYRVSARMPLEVDAAMNHVGFRCVKDIEP